MWSEKVPSQQPSAISDVFYLHLLCLIILASTGVFLYQIYLFLFADFACFRGRSEFHELDTLVYVLAW